MANTMFDSPLFVKADRYLQELASLEDAFDFLDEWPLEKRGETYEVILRACRLAADGIFPLPAIRENLRRFLIKERVLANIEEVPLLIGNRSPNRNIGS